MSNLARMAAWTVVSAGWLGCTGCASAPAATAPSSIAPKQTMAASPAAPEEPQPILTSKKVRLRRNIAFESCHVSFHASGDDPAVAVKEMAQGCADVTSMHPLAPPVTASASTSFALHVEAGHCYRVYGVASGTVQDLDVRIQDSSGEVAGQDETDNKTPVLSEDGVVCFDAADEATVRVAIGAGSGRYAVQVWSD